MTGSTRSSGGLDDRRKRLLFRCWHRGTREMDLILGRFADAEIANLADDELAQLEHLIEVPDPDLYAALTGNRPPAAGICERPVRPHQVVSGTGSRRMKAPARSPAELLAPGRPLTFANVAEGAEGLVVSDLARAVAARPKPAGGQPRRGLPRRPAHAATGPRAGILRARFAGAAVSGLGLPALRPGVAAWRHPGAAA